MNYLKALQVKRDEVWTELDTLRAEWRQVEERISVKEVQLRNLDELLALEGVTGSRGAAENGVRSAPASFLDAAAEIVGESPAGVHYQELLATLNSRGINVPGRDPGANLIAHLTRDERFVRTGRGTYGLREKHAAASPPTRRARPQTLRRAGGRRK